MIFDMTKRKSGGGGWSVDDIAQNLEPSGDIVLEGSYAIAQFAFTRKSAIETVMGNAISGIGKTAFASCNGLKRVYFPNIINIGDNAFDRSGLLGVYADSFPNITSTGMQSLAYLSSADFIVLPKIQNFASWQCAAYGSFRLLDLGGAATAKTTIGSDALQGCANLSTIILRYPEVSTLNGVNCFNNTPFKSGGTGGTIYIPKSLYDHLGDGTANDYKAATNWSKLDGYGTVTWAKIEGSIYETHYADGTPIQTT